MPRPALLLLALLTAAGCDVGVESTYPPPGDYPLVSVEALLAAPPGRYNVAGVVQGPTCYDDLDGCPDLLLAEAFFEDVNPPAAALDVKRPEQFRARSTRYLFSVEAVGAPSYARVFAVLGYSEAAR